MIESDEQFTERLARELRAPQTFGPAFTQRVMIAVRAAAIQQKRPRNFLEWLIVPRPMMLSPVTASAFTAIMLLAGFAISRRPDGIMTASPVRAVPATIATGRDTIRVVQFVFVAPDARRVTLVGDFNDWDKVATPLKREGENGLWTVSLPLPHGRHQYAFMVDGRRWMLDPSAPKAVENSYGTPNSVVTVTADAL